MAYVSTEAVGNSTQSGDGLVKIPYRIFVGGIAFNTTKEELKDFFSRYGAVRDSKIIRDNEGLSKGYGFVTFYREDDAQKVMNMGTIFFKEKRLNISEAYRKQPITNQQTVMTMPMAASTTWPSAVPTTPVYYTTMNQGAQMPTIQIPSPRTWPVVPGGVTAVAHQPAEVVWMPQYFYY
ncbi:protein boule-like [Oculina patagonica]